MKMPLLQGATIGLCYAGAYHGFNDLVNRGEEVTARQHFLTGLATGAGIGLASANVKTGIVSSLLIGSTMAIVKLLRADKTGIYDKPLEEYRKSKAALYMRGKQPTDLNDLLRQTSTDEKIIIRQE